MRALYLVHDLGDAAVERRVQALIWGGADVVLCGFYRKDMPPQTVSGQAAFALGRTFDAQFSGRIKAVLSWCFRPKALLQKLKGCEIVLCRNLEMLALGFVLILLARSKAKLVYECLDIHSKMLTSNMQGAILKAIERVFLRRTQMIIYSSPAFDEVYFTAKQAYKGQRLLVENKVQTQAAPDNAKAYPLTAPPWVIGWYGIIRCQKSLDMLDQLTRSNPNLLVLIAGRPALNAFHDFHSQIAENTQLKFLGAYTLFDLNSLYAQCHFTWAIDYFEEGLNSAWLLPNRLYEGGLYGGVPIALSTVQTGKWLAKRGVGVLIEHPQPDLAAFFTSLTAESYTIMRQKARAIPYTDLVLTPDEARKITERLFDKKAITS